MYDSQNLPLSPLKPVKKTIASHSGCIVGLPLFIIFTGIIFGLGSLNNDPDMGSIIREFHETYSSYIIWLIVGLWLVSLIYRIIYEYLYYLLYKYNFEEEHAEITKDLAVNVSQGMERFLEKSLDLYLDGAKVDSLLISSDLKGEKADRIIISGPGFGVTQEDAVNDAIFNRNKLQTILITGSLPTKLEIIKLDSISPLLGKEFLNNSLLIAILALIGVGLIVYLRYRNFKIVLPIIFTVSSEIFIILGLAALFKYNLDLAAIVGLIAAVGTGVDDQIVITDEMLSGSSSNDKERLKSAFFIIFSAFAATVAAMIPLFWAGAGLLTGFALVTIAGVTIGVFITRPAYAVIIKFLLKD